MYVYTSLICNVISVRADNVPILPNIMFVISCASHVLLDCVIDAHLGYNCLSNDYMFSQKDLLVTRKRHFAPQDTEGNAWVYSTIWTVHSTATY
jgi:hypothetical protein